MTFFEINSLMTETLCLSLRLFKALLLQIDILYPAENRVKYVSISSSCASTNMHIKFIRPTFNKFLQHQ